MNYKSMIKHCEKKYGELWQYMLQTSEVKQELDFVEWKESQGETPAYVYEYALEMLDRVTKWLLCPANVNVGDGVTINLWSDRHAATVIKKTAYSVTVQQDTATLSPDFKPVRVEGGFAGHCINQDEQTYTYERNPNGRVETFRWSNKYGRYGTPGNPSLSKGRHEFYDYNF
jgi:hypothetical protein